MSTRRPYSTNLAYCAYKNLYIEGLLSIDVTRTNPLRRRLVEIAISAPNQEILWLNAYMFAVAYYHPLRESQPLRQVVEYIQLVQLLSCTLCHRRTGNAF